MVQQGNSFALYFSHAVLMRTLISTGLATVETKNVMYEKFKLVLYSRTEELDKEKNAELIREIGDTQVRQSKTYIFPGLLS